MSSFCKPLQFIVQLTRRWHAQSRGVRLGSEVWLGSGVDFRPMGQRSLGGTTFQKGKIFLGQETRIESGAILWAFGGFIRAGRNVFLGPQTIIYGHGGVEIGDQTLISMRVTILSSNHSVPDRGKEIRHQADILLPTRIGRDVWIGAHAVILGGVTIGDGCVIGAGSVVTNDMPPYSVAIGVPARVVRTRT